MRKSFSRNMRESVWRKYGGRCSYCGCKLEFKNLQIDHLHPVYVDEVHGKEVDNSFDNLMPACRQCNFYKSTLSLEDFRLRLKDTLFFNLKKMFNYRLAVKYGFIKETELIDLPVKFYFEEFSDENRFDRG